MSITKVKTPYELLVRWKDGAVAGSHVKFLEQIVEDGKIIYEAEGLAQSVSMADETGYPLTDILSTMQSTALTTAEKAANDLASEQALYRALESSALAANKAATAALTTEQAEHAKTKALLAEAEAKIPVSPAAVNGVPQQVTRKQARKALALAGVLGLVQPSINAITDPQARELVQIDWDDSATFERENPSLLALAQTLGLSDAQVDRLFVTAAAL